MRGEVIGVNSQIATSTGDYNGIGFALPSTEANYVYRQILRNGKVRRGFLGVFLDSVKKEFAEVYGLPEAKGAIITQIRDKSVAAAKAGLLKDDIVIILDGKQIKNHQDLIAKVASIVPGKEVDVTVLRESGKNLERKVISVKLDERPNNGIVSNDGTKRKLPIETVKVNSTPFVGLTFAEINTQSRRRYSLKGRKGVLISKIDPASYFADLKNSGGGEALNEGDIVQRINRVSVENMAGFYESAKGLTKGAAVVFHILRYDRNRRQFNPMVVQFTLK
jgi:serine protease Do